MVTVTFHLAHLTFYSFCSYIVFGLLQNLVYFSPIREKKGKDGCVCLYTFLTESKHMHICIFFPAASIHTS